MANDVHIGVDYYHPSLGGGFGPGYKVYNDDRDMKLISYNG